MIWIIYITCNILTHQVYIGVHQQEEPYEFDGYLGSGKRLLNAVKKYGKKNFFRETLLYYSSIEDAYSKEAEIVTEVFVAADWNYNITPGGNIPPRVDHTGRKHTDTSKLKQSKSQLHRFKAQEHPRGMKGKHFTFTKEACIIRSVVMKNNTNGKGNLGKKRSIESKALMSFRAKRRFSGER